MSNSLRILKYLCALLFDPVVRMLLRMVGFGARLKRLKIGLITFVGSAEFLKMAKIAEKTIRECDPAILTQMGDPFTIMHFANEVLSYPVLGYGIVSDSYVAWGSDGIVAVWVYFSYHAHISHRDRWAMTVTEVYIVSSHQAREKASLWLKEYQFPEELWRTICNEKT
jgi:hypothetical protein